MDWGFPRLVLLTYTSLVVKRTVGKGKVEDNTVRSLKAESRGIFPRDVSRSTVAVRLAQLVNDGYKDDIDKLAQDYDFDPADGIYLESGIDAVYLARVGDEYCSASFRGTTNYQIGDWFTNFDLGPVVFGQAASQQRNNENQSSSLDTASLQGCDVHRGYHDAYANFEYREVVEGFLSTCRSECLECETILTGHSQGGGIAEIAALYLKLDASDKSRDLNKNNNSVAVVTANDNDSTSSTISPYVITFGSPQSLGVGCRQLFLEEEKRRWFRYILTREESIIRKLVYDPIPLLYAHLLDPPEEADDTGDGFGDSFDGFFDVPIDQTYARGGGLAYIGYEILLSTEDPSAVLISKFDDHRFVDLSYIDLTGRAHYDSLYSEVLEAQDRIYNNNDNGDNGDHPDHSDDTDGDCCGREKDTDYIGSFKDDSSMECPRKFLPSSGFAEGSLCNPGERELSSTCAEGTTCEFEKESWFWESARHTCQPILVLSQETRSAPSSLPTSCGSSNNSSGSTAACCEEDTAVENNNEALAVIPEASTKTTSSIVDLSHVSSGAHQTRALVLLQSSWKGRWIVGASAIAIVIASGIC